LSSFNLFKRNVVRALRGPSVVPMGTFIENLATITCKRSDVNADTEADNLYTVYLSKSVIRDFRYLWWALEEEEEGEDDSDDDDDEVVSDAPHGERSAREGGCGAEGSDAAYPYVRGSTNVDDSKEEPDPDANPDSDPGDLHVSSLSPAGKKGETTENKISTLKKAPTKTPFPLAKEYPSKEANADDDNDDDDDLKHRNTTPAEPETSEAMMTRMGLPLGFLGDSFKKKATKIETFVLRGVSKEEEEKGQG